MERAWVLPFSFIDVDVLPINPLSADAGTCAARPDSQHLGNGRTTYARQMWVIYQLTGIRANLFSTA